MGVPSILLCLMWAGVAWAGEPRIFVLADGSVLEAEVLAELDTSWLIELPDGTKRRLGLDQVVEVIGDEGVVPVGRTQAPDDRGDAPGQDAGLMAEKVWVDVVPAQTESGGEPITAQTAPAAEVARAPEAAPASRPMEVVPPEQAEPAEDTWASAAEELPMEPVEQQVPMSTPQATVAVAPVDVPASDGADLGQPLQPAPFIPVEEATATPAADSALAEELVDDSSTAVFEPQPDDAPSTKAEGPLAIPAGQVGAYARTSSSATSPVEDDPSSAAPMDDTKADPSPEEAPSPTRAIVVSPTADEPVSLQQALATDGATASVSSRPRFGIGTGISAGAWAQPGGSSGSYDLFPLELRFYSKAKQGRSLDVVLNWFHGTGAGGPGTTWTAGLAMYSHRRREKNAKVSLAFAPGAELAFGAVSTLQGPEPIMGMWGHVRSGVDLQPFGDRTEWGVYARPSVGFMADLSGNSGFSGLMAGIVLEVTGTWLAR